MTPMKSLYRYTVRYTGSGTEFEMLECINRIVRVQPGIHCQVTATGPGSEPGSEGELEAHVAHAHTEKYRLSP